MESLGDVLKQLNRWNQTQGGMTVEERLERLKRHPIFREWFSSQTSGLEDTTLIKSLSHIIQYVREAESCTACPGLNLCPNTMRGFQSVLNVGDRQMVGLHMQKCEKKLADEKQSWTQSLIRSHYIPTEIMQATFQSIDRDKGRYDALNAMMEFCLNYQASIGAKGVYLHGSLGVGKSRIMGAAAKVLAERGIASLMVYVPDFFREMKEAIGDHTLQEKVHTLKKVPVLILDDIGAETLSAWARDEILGTILQYRVSEKLPTLYTSNWSLDELEEHFAYSNKGGIEKMKAMRIMERIRYYVDVYNVEGPNRRKS
jgi:primosomal protein DnaI